MTSHPSKENVEVHADGIKADVITASVEGATAETTITQPPASTTAAAPKRHRVSQTSQDFVDSLNDFIYEVYNEPTQGLFFVNRHLMTVGSRLIQSKQHIDEMRIKLQTSLTDLLEDIECVNKILKSQVNLDGISSMSPLKIESLKDTNVELYNQLKYKRLNHSQDQLLQQLRHEMGYNRYHKTSHDIDSEKTNYKKDKDKLNNDEMKTNDKNKDSHNDTAVNANLQSQNDNQVKIKDKQSNEIKENRENKQNKENEAKLKKLVKKDNEKKRGEENDSDTNSEMTDVVVPDEIDDLGFGEFLHISDMLSQSRSLLFDIYNMQENDTVPVANLK